VLTTLAEQIAIAVRNAQLFAEAHQARQEAEQANRVKSQFLASMSHELRTPLNAILNFTQFVSSGMLGTVNEEQVDTLGKVVYSGQHLLGLINDVLDISKIEAGALKLFIEPNVDLAQEASIVTDSARTLVGQKPVEIQLEVAPNLPHIVGDKRRIRQIMLNLVSNACKFTDKGSIRITLEAQQDNIVFAVHDTGAGIAPEDQGMIFELFRQSQTGLRQGEGTGLGLPISRRLAVAHGGSVWLESALGQGSTFYVSLPVHSTVLQIDEMPLEEIKHGV
jgi:signal transduction histidine kinase